MKREYIIRGQRTDNNEMVYGYLLHDNYIMTDYEVNIDDEYCLRDDSLFSVHPDTIGINTQTYDKNGKQIFEGDILKAYDDVYGVVEYVNGKFRADEIGETDFVPYDLYTLEQRDIEVVGNIHENKDIIEKLKQNG